MNEWNDAFNIMLLLFSAILYLTAKLSFTVLKLKLNTNALEIKQP